MGTVRRTEVVEMDAGEYHHFGLERAVLFILREAKKRGENPKEIKLIVNP